jgi:hypothetical protein
LERLVQFVDSFTHHIDGACASDDCFPRRSLHIEFRLEAADLSFTASLYHFARSERLGVAFPKERKLIMISSHENKIFESTMKLTNLS